MLTLIDYYLVPLAVTVAIGFVTGLWMFRGPAGGPRS